MANNFTKSCYASGEAEGGTPDRTKILKELKV